jgi:glycerophosphoryl diester phosphodiesterase
VRLHADGRVLRIGHRGAAALAPENTIASFQRAVELGVDLIEFDVLDLTDGTLVVAHSDDLSEVSHGAARGTVRTSTLEELRRVAPALPTFDEALAFLRDEAPSVGVQVDLKWYGYEAPVVDALRRHGLVERTVVSTFHARTLRAVAGLEPGLCRGLTYPYDRSGVSTRRVLTPVVGAALFGLARALPYRIGRLLESVGASAAVLHHFVVTRATVERCHARGAAVLAWTVDDPAVLRRVVQAGVDGVITNDPRIFGATLTP